MTTMLMRSFVLVLLMASCVLAADGPGDFRGMAIVRTPDATHIYASTMTDLPDPHYVNRWRFQFFPAWDSTMLLRSRHWTRLYTAATAKGTMVTWIESVGWFEFFPAEASIREFLIKADRDHDGHAEESRQQFVTIRLVGDALEVFIEEPR